MAAGEPVRELITTADPKIVIWWGKGGAQGSAFLKSSPCQVQICSEVWETLIDYFYESTLVSLLLSDSFSSNPLSISLSRVASKTYACTHRRVHVLVLNKNFKHFLNGRLHLLSFCKSVFCFSYLES